MKSMLAVLTLVFTSACSMAPHRSYLTEMEEDDSSLFEPRTDFVVVPGDTGRDYRSAQEWKRRIPASESMRRRELEERAIEQDLVRLENAQSEAAARHYQQFRARLGSTSERIYFLQLPGHAAREEYLAARGLVAESPVLPQERFWAAEQSEVVVGMTKDDVLESWGSPDRVDVAGNPRNENERWRYNRNGAVKYIFIEGGVVEGLTHGR
ncbi:MAG: hypothetical protein ACLGG7_11180 [Bacteriovoracia bacterium]